MGNKSPRNRSMKTIAYSSVIGLAMLPDLVGDGYFKFSKLGPLVTVGYENGPVADSTILAQVFAGRTPDDLRAVGSPIPFTAGRIFNTLTDVPFMEVGETAYVDFAAWDSSKWGLSFSGVPVGESVKSSTLTTQLRVQSSDSFLQIAFPEKLVVPSAVPEPTKGALLLLGASIFGWWMWRPLPAKCDDTVVGKRRAK